MVTNEGKKKNIPMVRLNDENNREQGLNREQKRELLKEPAEN